MRQRKFFTLDADEEFLGVIRPSLWTLVPRTLAAFTLVLFPVVFWSSLLNLGVLFGGCLGAISILIGGTILADTRRYYVDNGVYLTSRRAIDICASRRNVRSRELLWANVEKMLATRKGVVGLCGYGTVHIRGTKAEGFSLVIHPVWKPDLVVAFLPRVQ